MFSPVTKLSLIIVAAGCSQDGSHSADPSPTPPRDAQCVVATWNGGQLLSRDVDQLRARVTPAPAGADADEWAIDVYLAAQTLKVESSSPSDLIAAYSQWLQEQGIRKGSPNSAARLSEATSHIRQQRDLKQGPCFGEGAP